MQASAIPDLLMDSEVQRRTMVECQIRTFDVTDRRVIERFLEVPRELFVPDHVRNLAYSDIGFHVPAAGDARYLLPPLVLARLIQGGRIRSTDRVLDVAAGLGYGTAILSGLAADVVALEADDVLREGLEARLSAYGLTQVETRSGSLAEGVAADVPFDVILVNGAIQTNLDMLTGQLAEGGRLLAIQRGRADPTGHAGKAMCFEKHAHGVSARYLFDASAPCLRAFADAPQFVF